MGNNTEWRLANRHRQLQTRTTHHGNTPPLPPARTAWHGTACPPPPPGPCSYSYPLTPDREPARKAHQYGVSTSKQKWFKAHMVMLCDMLAWCMKIVPKNWSNNTKRNGETCKEMRTNHLLINEFNDEFESIGCSVLPCHFMSSGALIMCLNCGMVHVAENGTVAMGHNVID